MANKIVGTLLAVGMGAAGLAGGIALGENTAKQEYQEVVDQKDTQLSASATQLEEINAKLAERETEIVLLKDNVETLKTDKQTLQTTINEKNESITQLNSQIEASNTEHAEEVAGLNSQIDTLKTEKADLQTSISEKQIQIDNLTETLENTNAENTEEVAKLTQQINTLETEKSDLQTSVNEKNAEIDQLNSQIETSNAEHTEQIANLNSQIDTLEVEKVDLQTQLENKDEQITTLNTTITEKETALESLQSEYNELSTLHTELQEAYDNLQTENSANEEEVNNLTGQVAVLNTRIQELETQLEASSGIEEVSEMPVASEDIIGVIYKYTGETNADFINGKFYVITLHNNVYSWTLVNEQDTPSADKGMVIAYLMTKSGEELANVNVTLTNVDTSESYEIVTDSHGRISKEVDAGIYTISASEIEGYTTPETQTITITANTVDYTNMVYKSAIAVSSVFGENDAATVAYVSEQIAANNMTSEDMYNTYGWSVGDTTDITLTTGEVIQMQIIGVNHDVKSDGTGKVGLTLQMVNCLSTKYAMNSTSTNVGGYAASKMKTETLPSIKALLPQEWQDVIKLVDKKSANGGSSYTETLTLSEDIFLLSEIEVFGTSTKAKDGANEGMIYEYWDVKTGTDRIKNYDADADGVADVVTIWWLRSCDYYASFICVYTDGSSTQDGGKFAYGVSFAFCV